MFKTLLVRAHGERLVPRRFADWQESPTLALDQHENEQTQSFLLSVVIFNLILSGQIKSAPLIRLKFPNRGTSGNFCVFFRAGKFLRQAMSRFTLPTWVSAKAFDCYAKFQRLRINLAVHIWLAQLI